MIEVVQVELDANDWPWRATGNPIAIDYRDAPAWEAAWRAIRWRPVLVCERDGWKVYRIQGGTVVVWRGVRQTGTCPTCGHKIKAAQAA